MGEQGQKLVLATIRLAKGLVQVRVLNGNRRASGQFLRDIQVLVIVCAGLIPR